MRLATVLSLVFTFLTCAVFGLGGPENVLVVQNSNSSVSANVASYYMSSRSIPSANLVTISTADSTTSWSNQFITYQNYLAQIEQPICDFLTSNGLTDSIQYIVLTKGIPHRLDLEIHGGSSGGQSVDSLLAAIDLVNPLELEIRSSESYYGNAYANRYWRSTEPFTHSQYGGYIVTRLDGYTEEDAKALVDRSTALSMPPYNITLDIDAAKGVGDVALQPKSLLTSSGNIDPNYQMNYSDYNADIKKAYQTISDRPHLSVHLDETSIFIGSPYSLTGYISWGSNDGNFSKTTYNSLVFTDKSIVETAVSSSGRTFIPESSGQSLIADLIAQGAAGAKGYVSEPFLDAVASPTVLLDFFTSGRNLAESYFAASRFVGWKDIIIGDPLCTMTGAVLNSAAGAKSYEDGMLVTLYDQIVTAGSDAFADGIYVQDLQGVSGIRVSLSEGHAPISEGNSMCLQGVLSTIDGERVLLNSRVVY